MSRNRPPGLGCLFARQAAGCCSRTKDGGRVLRNDIRLGSANPDKNGAIIDGRPVGASVFSSDGKRFGYGVVLTNGERSWSWTFRAGKRSLNSPASPAAGTPKGD